MSGHVPRVQQCTREERDEVCVDDDSKHDQNHHEYFLRYFREGLLKLMGFMSPNPTVAIVVTM